MISLNRRFQITALAAFCCLVFILYLNVGEGTNSEEKSPTQKTPNLRGSDAYTAKAASYDIFRYSSPGWDVLEQKFKGFSNDQNVLDLGCGSGAFFKQLVSLKPRAIDAIDGNQAMVEKAAMRIQSDPELSSSPIHLRQGNITELPSNTYDIVFCAQVLQNLTPDENLAAAEREVFLKHILRVLKPGGKAVLTTRSVSPGSHGRWSDLYWYADPAVVPRAVATMELMVPRHPLQEMTRAGFVNTELLYSNATVIRTEAYLQPRNVLDAAFRSADSFFQHVRGEEMKAFVHIIEEREAEGSLKSYVIERDSLRNGLGHVAILIGAKSKLS